MFDVEAAVGPSRRRERRSSRCDEDAGSGFRRHPAKPGRCRCAIRSDPRAVTIFRDPDRGDLAPLPLSALLSQTLVALTIDLDDEFERQMRHATTTFGATPGGERGPCLVSLAMWASCMRFLDDADGLPIAELERRARMKTNLAGMKRWKYVTIETGGVVRPTRLGRKARETWTPVFGIVKQRWRETFGASAVDELRSSLGTIVEGLDPALPDFLPSLGYGLSTAGALRGLPESEAAPVVVDDMPLPTLLSRALLSIALSFESRSEVSLAIAADALRPIDDAGVRVRDLPRLSGVSKEALAMALGFLERDGYVAIAPDANNARTRVAVPTERRRRARAEYATLLASIETSWRERFGTTSLDRLRSALERLVCPPNTDRSPLLACIAPRPENWRASRESPQTLPHYPMVLHHRGGFPDGS
jgi:DNA-binding MarR family transcriptional regulator